MANTISDALFMKEEMKTIATAVGTVTTATIRRRRKRRIASKKNNKAPDAELQIGSGKEKTAYSINEAIVFDGGESSDPDGDTLSFQWDFGDGSGTSTKMIKTYSYSTVKQGNIELNTQLQMRPDSKTRLLK